MYYIGMLALFFVLLLAICLVIYVLLIKAFYWGDKEKPPEKKN